MPGETHEARTLRGQRAAVWGLLTNVALAAGKLAAGLLGHSYALIADAVESMTDILGSVVIWGGLHIAARPADKEHPYGHGKAEALAALVVAALVFLAGVWIAAEAVRELLEPRRAPAAFTLVVLVGVVAVKEVLFRVVRRVGRETGSGAVEVDAWHHRSDAITSGAAFLGISIALIGGKGWERADAWAALAASGVILYNAWRLVQVPLHELMDAEPTQVLGPARETALAVSGVRGVEKTRARKSGARVWLEMHVEVDPEMTVRDSHAVAGRVRAAIREGMPSVADVLVHVEPFKGEPVRGA